jgi:hypothetical protein
MANDTEAAGRQRHDRSRAVRGLWLSKEQASLYQAEWKPIRGFPDDADHCSGFNKLHEWPDFVQRRGLDRFEDLGDARLLLQVDNYCNGEDTQGRRPRGLLYFLGAAVGFAGAEFRRMRVRNSVHLSIVAWDLEGAATERVLP